MRLYLDQSIVKASRATAPGSGLQAMQWGVLWFSLDSNISTSGSPNFDFNSLNAVWSSDHSMLLLRNSRLALSASVFSFPGKWEIDSVNFRSMHRIKIFLVMSLQLLGFVPPILRMYETAVVL